MNINTSDDRRTDSCHWEKSIFPRAIISGTFVQTKQLMQPTGNFRIDWEQMSDIVTSPTDLPRTKTKSFFVFFEIFNHLPFGWRMKSMIITRSEINNLKKTTRRERFSSIINTYWIVKCVTTMSKETLCVRMRIVEIVVRRILLLKSNETCRQWHAEKWRCRVRYAFDLFDEATCDFATCQNSAITWRNKRRFFVNRS